VLSQLKNKAKELWRDPTDDEVVKIIQKESKILKETADGYQAQWYDTQYQEEIGKIEVLAKYLPQMLTEAELVEIIQAKQSDLWIADEDLAKSKWRLIWTIMKEYGATVDGGMLNRLLSK
jgi:uncharacterized protein YqeY